MIRSKSHLLRHFQQKCPWNGHDHDRPCMLAKQGCFRQRSSYLRSGIGNASITNNLIMPIIYKKDVLYKDTFHLISGKQWHYIGFVHGCTTVMNIPGVGCKAINQPSSANNLFVNHHLQQYRTAYCMSMSDQTCCFNYRVPVKPPRNQPQVSVPFPPPFSWSKSTPKIEWWFLIC